MAYRNMVRDSVQDSFDKDLGQPGIMHDAVAMEQKKKRKKKKDSLDTTPSSGGPSETLLGDA